MISFDNDIFFKMIISSSVGARNWCYLQLFVHQLLDLFIEKSRESWMESIHGSVNPNSYVRLLHSIQERCNARCAEKSSSKICISVKGN